MPPLRAGRPASGPRVGKRVRGSLYVHRGAVSMLDGGAASTVAEAAKAAAPVVWNVARLDRDATCLLEYEDFDEVSFPRLLASTIVDRTRGVLPTRGHRGASNPLILHRKELLVRPDHPNRAKWAALTAELEARGLFADANRIGRERRWAELMTAAGLPWARRP